MGGKNLDISLYLLDDGVFELKSSINDKTICGDVFDSILIEYCMNEFIKKNEVKQEDVENNIRATYLLKN